MNSVKMAALLQQAANYSSYGVKTKYLSFDDGAPTTSALVDCGNDNSIRLTNSITVEAWIKKNGSDSNYRIVCARWATPTNRRVFFMSVYAGKVRVLLSSNGTGVTKQYEGSVTVDDNAWHHLAFTFTSDTLKIYTDGVEDASVNKISDNTCNTLYSTDVSLTIGSTGLSATANEFLGFIDEVRIWNHARTEAEIKRHMNTRLTGWETGLVARYSMDKGSGSDLPDDQKDGLNNGTITGATWVTL